MIKFKITNAEITEQLKEITVNKLTTLDKFIGDAPTICEVEFEKITNHHQHGLIHRVEINLQIDGKLFRSEATSDSFEKAIDEARGDITHKLNSSRGKRNTLWMSGARKIKKMMRWGSKA